MEGPNRATDLGQMLFMFRILEGGMRGSSILSTRSGITQETAKVICLYLAGEK